MRTFSAFNNYPFKANNMAMIPAYRRVHDPLATLRSELIRLQIGQIKTGNSSLGGC